MPVVPKRLFSLAMEHFGDKNKARLWFDISNPELRGMRPRDYHQNGNWDILENKIKAALKGYPNEK